MRKKTVSEGLLRLAFLIAIGLGTASVASADNASPRKPVTPAAGKGRAAFGHMVVQNGATFFRVPVADFPDASGDFKSRASFKMWVIRKETVETMGQYKDGKAIAEVKSFLTAKVGAPEEPGMDDCGITETWLKSATREGQDPSFKAKTKLGSSTSYWNMKGFEVPDGFNLVDTKTETKLTDSLLLELVNKAGGDKWMAAEFKKGDARYFVVPESTDDEFKAFFSIYFKASAKSGLALLKRLDFVESCP